MKRSIATLSAVWLALSPLSSVARIRAGGAAQSSFAGGVSAAISVGIPSIGTNAVLPAGSMSALGLSPALNTVNAVSAVSNITPVSLENPSGKVTPSVADISAPDLGAAASLVPATPSEKAVVVVRDEVASWGAVRHPEDSISVPFSAGSSALAPRSSRAAAVHQTGVPPEPSAPAPKRGWIKTVAATAAVFLALDWGTKFLFLSAGLSVFHVLDGSRLIWMAVSIPIQILGVGYYASLANSKEAPLKSLQRFRERHPILGGAVYGLLTALTFPVGLGQSRYAGDLPQKYPLVGKLVKITNLAAAALIAGALGNGIEAVVNGQVVDFIPFGHGRMNLADCYVFLGAPMLWMSLDFFKAAREADKTGEPITFKNWRYYLLPLLGFIGFIYSTYNGYETVPMAAWYVALFSTLFAIGIFAADFVIQRFVQAFNRILVSGKKTV